MSTRTSILYAKPVGGKRFAFMAANRQAARQAVIQAKRSLAPAPLPIDISRATLNRLANRVRGTELKTVDIPYTSVYMATVNTSITLLNGIV